MESIGEKLRSRRTEEGYSINQVSRDTNIAKAYLEALESEDFLAFPGEPYLIGFLRNYSEYLGLDVDEMISLYRNFKIQEQPVPMDELIMRRGPSPVIIVLIVLLVAGALGAAGFFLYPKLMLSGGGVEKPAEAAVSEPAAEDEPVVSGGPVFAFNDEIVEQRFESDTAVEFSQGSDSRRFVILLEDDAVVLAAAAGNISLKLGEEKDVDLNGDGDMDLKVLVRDIDTSAATAVLRLDKSVYVPRQPRVEASDLPVGSTQVASRTLEPRVLYRASSPEVITMTIGFRGNSLFRYAVDNDPREERFFQKGEALRLSFSNSLRIWASNGGVIQGRLKGEDVPLGRSGQIVVWLLKWRITDGKYELVLNPVY